MSFQNAKARESAPRLPDLTQITCLADGHPLPGAWAKLIVTVAHKNNFSVIAGPADPDGASTAASTQPRRLGGRDRGGNRDGGVRTVRGGPRVASTYAALARGSVRLRSSSNIVRKW
jgi:hypothetical protein